MTSHVALVNGSKMWKLNILGNSLSQHRRVSPSIASQTQITEHIHAQIHSNGQSGASVSLTLNSWKESSITEMTQHWSYTYCAATVLISNYSAACREKTNQLKHLGTHRRNIDLCCWIWSQKRLAFNSACMVVCAAANSHCLPGKRVAPGVSP